ncbi:hypothetical protein CR513_43238, partial [Mucuna pruriens]
YLGWRCPTVVPRPDHLTTQAKCFPLVMRFEPRSRKSISTMSIVFIYDVQKLENMDIQTYLGKLHH